MNHNPNAGTHWTAVRVSTMAVLVAVAVFLGWKAWDVHIAQSCWKKEWPHLQWCEEINGSTPLEQWTKLQERFKRNPGDSEAVVQLMVLATSQDLDLPQAERNEWLDRAIQVYPQHTDVLTRQALRAINAAQWPQALDPLIRLSRYHTHTASTHILAQMVQGANANPALREALTQAVRDDMGWVPRVLQVMPGMKLPMGDAWWLVAEAMAHHSLEPRIGQLVMGRLKAEGLWTEAYMVWLHLWKRPMPLLFNGDFERDFVAQGFDWEVGGPNDHRAGALVELVGRKDRGRVLRVDFGGKGFRSPVIRQHLVLPSGKYRLQGSWQSRELRSAQGLTWAITCLGGPGSQPQELARSEAMKTTGKDWKTWQMVVDVPPQDCGPGLQLTLQPFAAYESRAGMQGEILFDDISLQGVQD